MIYKYTQQDKKHIYENESFYGEIRLESYTALELSTLDLCVLEISKKPTGKGTIQAKEGTIAYEYNKKDMWEDD